MDLNGTLFRITGPNFVGGIVFAEVTRRGVCCVKAAPLLIKLLRLKIGWTRISEVLAICPRRGYRVERRGKDGEWWRLVSDSDGT